jgi:sulfoxide reductase heme-binding subunit YedZ
MNSSMVGLLISVAITLLLVFPLAKPLRLHPSVFYIIALALTALYVWAIWSGVNLAKVRGLCMVQQKGYLSSLLLAIVMFTGCFDEGTAIRKHLQPIRAELSILSFIFIVGHLCMYLPGYFPRIGSIFSSHIGVALSLVVSFVLTALFALLAVTSFKVIRRSMNAKTWKSIQRLAYLMVALFALHVAFVLGGSAFSGRITLATVSFTAYILIILVYAALRIRKYRRDLVRRNARTEDISVRASEGSTE